ncbi:HAMP domain-containing protein [Parasedimentitalea marina]|uniref:histidine kinase n=1 Tax=Parasedimentitalea marina TaxID=2483033 RepID=A0A3T0N219_9RHOB|nr:ATP-binding protein [Parasedimentitalea marina]AZV78055.1 HAMP domain-containing protein [Parasedimentitalea marina]
MFFPWLKRYMPRSLYGRAALIMMLPIVVLQLVVSIAFIQRHLQDVTAQMTSTILRELEMISEFGADSPTQDAMLKKTAPLLAPLRMKMRFLDAAELPVQDELAWNEFSGRVVRDTLRKNFAPVLAVQFPDNRQVKLIFANKLGPVEVSFNRRRVTAAAPHQLIVTMLFFGVFMTTISILYMRNQLRPIKLLADAAQAFGRGRTVVYKPRGATEVRIAGSAFLDMRARIERQIEQRTLMLSGVSHDLRTPLTRMKLGLALLDEEDAEPLMQDVDEMRQLLDAFLDFSRGVSTSSPEKTDPQEMVSSIVENWRREGKDVMLGEISSQGTVMLRAGAMRRAIDNLVSNAVRYGSRARVSVTLTERSLRIRVEDDGPGIPQDQYNEAMRPFTRLDPSRNQDLGSGVGLGLAIVADIARAHGGALRLGKSGDLGGLQADIVIGR